jgi:hypothetical protein
MSVILIVMKNLTKNHQFFILNIKEPKLSEYVIIINRDSLLSI